jgi:hypothetical protein
LKKEAPCALDGVFLVYIVKYKCHIDLRLLHAEIKGQKKGQNKERGRTREKSSSRGLPRIGT